MANIEAYGTNIVSNGASGSGGLTQQEHEWLESLASYTPNMYDVNPTKVNSGEIPGRICIAANSTKTYIPVCGYAKLSLYKTSASGTYFRWVYVDDTESANIEVSRNAWTSYYDIPSNAKCITVFNTYGSGSDTIYYSVVTEDSPYNPDNQS